MYPEFTLDGIEYKAERNYTNIRGFPVAIVMCKRMHIPEEKNPRKRWQRILHIAMPGIIGFGIMLVLLNRVGYETMFSTWEGWLVMVGDIAILSAGVIRNYYLDWNLDRK